MVHFCNSFACRSLYFYRQQERSNLLELSALQKVVSVLTRPYRIVKILVIVLISPVNIDFSILSSCFYKLTEVNTLGSQKTRGGNYKTCKVTKRSQTQVLRGQITIATLDLLLHFAYPRQVGRGFHNFHNSIISAFPSEKCLKF